jgi:hypothetical protein
MKDRLQFAALLLGLSLATARSQTHSLKLPPIAAGPFKADWSSLTNYQTPEWFRDAKFGIWAHWGPQCQPEHGDWYARQMYMQGRAEYDSHLAEYGHPSTNGFKDVIRVWNGIQGDVVKEYKNGSLQVWVKELADGSKAVALFNRSEKTDKIAAAWKDLGLTGKMKVRDLWQHADLGQFTDSYSADVASHAAAVVKMSAP